MVSPYDLEQHRAALTGHCYRMMGSAADADDAVQETMVRAWRGLGGFEERASLRTASPRACASTRWPIARGGCARSSWRAPARSTIPSPSCREGAGWMPPQAQSLETA